VFWLGSLPGIGDILSSGLERTCRTGFGLLAPVRESGAPASGVGVWVCSGLRARPSQGDHKLLRQTIITPFD
jgi:hypothetical protein